MQYVYVLKPGFLNMAIEEIRALCPDIAFTVGGNLLFSESFGPWYSRLALTRSVHVLEGESPITDIITAARSIKFSSSKPASFYVDVHGSKEITNRQIAEAIAPSLGSPRADSRNPEFRVDVFCIENKAYFTSSGKFIRQDFRERRAHLRPAHHPSSLHPMIARACVNLTGATKTIVDPMCGAGGFLIEAGLMGLIPVGFDIDSAMVWRSRTNLDYYGIEENVTKTDSLTIRKKFDHIVTDLPYGRSTKNLNREELYPKFLSWLKQHCKKRAVVIFPDYSKWEEYCKNAHLKIVQVHDLFVHKTLTRKIVVLSP